MKRLNTFAVSILIVILPALAASCGGANIGIDQPAENTGNAQQVIEEQVIQNEIPDLAKLDEMFSEETAGQEKGSSWISHPNHLTPALSFLGAVDGGDPNCFLLQGLKDSPAGANFKGPLFAYALYQIPLGALETDLLDMKVAAQIGSATDNYYAAIADYSSMSWDFYGPLNAPDWSTDMPALGYDFTSPAGNLYMILIALPGESLHITDITLNFKEREKPNEDPTMWNVWGKAFESYATGSAHGGMDVIFRDINTSAWFVTLADASGNWGMNVPTGQYDFWVIGNEMLLDVSGPVAMIDWLPDGVGTRLDINGSGQVVYQGSNAAYTGVVVPMPLITANQF